MNLKIVRAGLAAGAVLNVMGWLGNQLLLGPMWRDTIHAVAPLRTRTWVSEVVSLLPDFFYGLALAWLFVKLLESGATRGGAAVRASACIWAVGAMTTYLGIWNSGFIPGMLALATTGLALVTFLPTGWLVAKMLAGERATP